MFCMSDFSRVIFEHDTLLLPKYDYFLQQKKITTYILIIDCI